MSRIIRNIPVSLTTLDDGNGRQCRYCLHKIRLVSHHLVDILVGYCRLLEVFLTSDGMDYPLLLQP